MQVQDCVPQLYSVACLDVIWSEIFHEPLEFYPIILKSFILSFILLEILNFIPLSHPKLDFILLSQKALAPKKDPEEGIIHISSNQSLSDIRNNGYV